MQVLNVLAPARNGPKGARIKGFGWKPEVMEGMGGRTVGRDLFGGQ